MRECALSEGRIAPQPQRDVDTNQPIYDVRTVQERDAEALTGQRFATVALGIFAALGIVLAALGV